MKKIMVIGPSGAGKSVFSRKLSEKLNIPVYHLDNYFWNKDRTSLTRQEFIILLYEILIEDKWIIDGDYSKTYEIRMNSCDTIIFLDYPLEVCLKGVEERIGTKRPDIPWVEEEFDPEFKAWIIRWFDDKRPGLLKLLDEYKDKREIHVFKNREEADSFLNNIE